MAISAQSVVDRIQKQLGSGWENTPVDTFMAGKPETAVTGIVTTYAPTLEVLRKAVAGKKNFIISRESPWWARHPSQFRPRHRWLWRRHATGHVGTGAHRPGLNG